jgi:hypothetical protein
VSHSPKSAADIFHMLVLQIITILMTEMVVAKVKAAVAVAVTISLLT